MSSTGATRTLQSVNMPFEALILVNLTGRKQGCDVQFTTSRDACQR